MEKFDLRKDGQFTYDEDENDPVILLAARTIGADTTSDFALEVDASSHEEAVRAFGLWDCMVWRDEGMTGEFDMEVWKSEGLPKFPGMDNHAVTYEVIPESIW